MNEVFKGVLLALAFHDVIISFKDLFLSLLEEYQEKRTKHNFR